VDRRQAIRAQTGPAGGLDRVLHYRYNAQIVIGKENYFLREEGFPMAAKKDQATPDLRISSRPTRDGALRLLCWVSPRRFTDPEDPDCDHEIHRRPSKEKPRGSVRELTSRTGLRP
jgi:hypothetical protein